MNLIDGSVTYKNSKNSLQTAVLFLIFNRMDTTKLVFEEIRKARPARLYISADGARKVKDGESEKVLLVREYVLKNIDWECEVKTLFREDNLGCKYAVSSALNWFFENEEEGIILEDDCLPNQSFFGFCEAMLHKYRHDSRMSMVTGTNYLLNVKDRVRSDYFFSRHFSIWGWATWRRAWKTYDVELDELEFLLSEAKDYEYMNLTPSDSCFYSNLMTNLKSKGVDTWDFQWVFNCIYSYSLCVTPSVNLISNLGVIGTHSEKRTKNNFLDVFEIENRDYSGPKWVAPNAYHDRLVSRRNFKRGVLSRFKSMVKNPLKWLYEKFN